ncbi:IclR family transcriptional regulator [Roseomonas populi]|uniref:IclR family transcriptional regulator n=1 Tax=Roseomonas populi TaxID=3121582 RepID=A0ABT1WZ92_9PROT|nr:IclR family transcriptional regulator [Roseomonas pecuniae]MCR0981176.1 IclR family transcriptional regulator [Roseomonas pecuniae]
MSTNATEAGEGESVRAVQRAVAILKAFTSERPRLTVVELQRLTGISRPTLYRLLQTLIASGLVQASGEPQRFGLGPAVMSLAHVWTSEIDVSAIARPVLERLRDVTGETAALFILRGDKRLCILEMPSRHVLNITRGVGETEHISRGASGKAILAHVMEDDALAQSIWRSLPSEVNRAKLSADLQRCREEGMAISLGEVFRGAVAIAAPFFGAGQQVAGSVGLFGPEARIDPAQAQHFGQLAIEAANEITAALGGTPPARKGP